MHLLSTLAAYDVSGIVHLEQGTLEAHTIKSEHMPIMLQGHLDDRNVSETDIKAAKFEHVCEFCDRPFNTRHGLAVHVSRWCGEAEREFFPRNWKGRPSVTTTTRSS